MPGQILADAIPDEHGIFRGLAQAPLHIHNAIAELVDNAIAAKQERFSIRVDISESTKTGLFEVSVADDCLGISLDKLKNHVFKVGRLPPPGSPYLREHGFGLKNVLAKVEALKGSWRVMTRDDIVFKKKEFYAIQGPLQYQLPIKVLPSNEWPSQGPAASGTMVVLTVPLNYLQTVTRGIRGRPPTTVGVVVTFLREHLGVFYRGYLEGKHPIGEISTSINWGKPEYVDPVSPDYKTKTKVPQFSVRSGKATIHVEGEHGEIEPNSSETRSRLYYYKNSPESQGVDFRIGNRVVATRLVTEIWQRPRHPTLNPFCGEFAIQPVVGSVPRTLNNKTSIDFDDELWTDIADGIRRKVNLPKWKGARTEAELREELTKQLEAHKLPGDDVKENYDCFAGAGVVIDILRDETHRAGELIIYETKAGKVSPLDVYQLRLYWDGLVQDGRQPTTGVLVGKEWTTGAQTVMSFLNSSKDVKGSKYRLEFKKWEDFGISPL